MKMVSFSSCIRECAEISHLIAKMGNRCSEVKFLAWPSLEQGGDKARAGIPVPLLHTEPPELGDHDVCLPHFLGEPRCLQHVRESISFLLKYTRIDYDIRCKNHLDFKDERGGFKEICIN